MKKSNIDLYTRIFFFFIISFFLLSVLSVSTSPLYSSVGSESAIFKIMGEAILNGKIPYVDIYDNNLPLIFYINSIGIKISQTHGLFILQTISLTISLSLIYSLARLFTSTRISSFIILITLVLFSAMVEEGNSGEEWILPFISLSLYLTFRYEKEQDIDNKINAYICGMCLGVVMFIHVGATLLMLGILSGYIIVYLDKGNIKKTRRYIVSYIVGALTFSFPFAMWLYSIGSLQEMIAPEFIFAAITNNYFQQNISFIFLPISLFLYITGIFICYVVIEKKHLAMHLSRRFRYIIMTVTIFTIVPLIVADKANSYIIIIPFVAFVLSMIYRTDEIKQPFIPALAIMLPFTIPMFGQIKDVSINMIDNSYTDKIYCSQLESLADEIPASERDNIYNINLKEEGLAFFTYNKITPCNKYLIKNTDSNTSSLFNDTFSDPLWLVCEEHYDNSDNPAFNNYTLVSAINIDSVNTRAIMPKRIAIYKLKNIPSLTCR